jgi:hypothetical protein
MAIKPQIKALAKQFEKENPQAATPVLTSGAREWDEQLEIILQPKRKSNYLNIKKRFLSEFELPELPSYDDLTDDQKGWWKQEIMKQAGKPNGFAHVGGCAQDVSVKSLDLDERMKLWKIFDDAGWGVLPERVTTTGSELRSSEAAQATKHGPYEESERYPRIRALKSRKSRLHREITAAPRR